MFSATVVLGSKTDVSTALFDSVRRPKAVLLLPYIVIVLSVWNNIGPATAAVHHIFSHLLV